jgi:hypothetical protein
MSCWDQFRNKSRVCFCKMVFANDSVLSTTERVGASGSTKTKWSEDGMFMFALMYCLRVFWQIFNSWKWTNPSVRGSCFSDIHHDVNVRDHVSDPITSIFQYPGIELSTWITDIVPDTYLHHEPRSWTCQGWNVDQRLEGRGRFKFEEMFHSVKDMLCRGTLTEDLCLSDINTQY